MMTDRQQRNNTNLVSDDEGAGESTFCKDGVASQTIGINVCVHNVQVSDGPNGGVYIECKCESDEGRGEIQTCHLNVAGY